MNILLSNDDGYQSPGLQALASELAVIADIHVVAPDRDRSGASNSLTLDNPIRARQAENGFTFVNGTPTDCVHLAITGLLECEPDMVVSGINSGANMGDDVLYSGTVAAAMEGTILGIPSIAISFAGEGVSIPDYGDLLERLLRSLLERDDFPEQTFFNINIPAVPAERIDGVRITQLGQRTYSDSLTRSSDPGGHEYFWIGGGRSHWSGGEESDFRAVEAGCVSVTPLHMDLTNYRLLESVREWKLGL